MTDQTTEQLSDMVSTTITHNGRQMRIVGYEINPKRTRANKDAKPIFWLVEADKPRQPPYEFWEQVLCSDVAVPVVSWDDEDEPEWDADRSDVMDAVKTFYDKPNGNGRPYTRQERLDQRENGRRLDAEGHGH